MNKRYEKQINSFKYHGEPIRFTLGTLILTCLSVLFIMVATFTQITLVHPYIPLDAIDFLAQSTDSYSVFEHFTKSYKYIPQIPVIFFIVALMGRKYAISSVLIYILLGLFFPIFALGGGIRYLFEYGFGYILAFIPAMFFAGTILKGKTSFLRVLAISFIGVCIIHVLGVLYMVFIATLRHAPMEFITSWILSQSGVQILYDIFFSVVSIYLGRGARKILWLVMC